MRPLKLGSMVALKTMRLRWFWIAGCAAAVCCCAAVWDGPVWAAKAAGSASTGARSAKTAQSNLTPWELAERGRETLEAIPEESRTKNDYVAAMDGFRAIYHDRPGDVHAPSAVYAVAELLTEQGRTLRDEKSLKAAVGQYEFLRTQYPGSSLRVMALLAEAQIEANDLGDVAAGREKYALFLKQYPASPHAEEAKAGLDALTRPVASRDQAATRSPLREAAPSRAVTGKSKSGASVSTAAGEPLAAGSSLGATPVTQAMVPPAGVNAASGGVAPERGCCERQDCRPAGDLDAGGCGARWNDGRRRRANQHCQDEGRSTKGWTGAGVGDPSLVDANVYAGGD